MPEEKILTLHPDPVKTGRNISLEKYELLKKTMLKILKSKPLTHKELMDGMTKELTGKFEGSIGWFAETVKLDLEARKFIGRTNDKPQRYQLLAEK